MLARGGVRHIRAVMRVLCAPYSTSLGPTASQPKSFTRTFFTSPMIKTEQTVRPARQLHPRKKEPAPPSATSVFIVCVRLPYRSRARSPCGGKERREAETAQGSEGKDVEGDGANVKQRDPGKRNQDSARGCQFQKQLPPKDQDLAAAPSSALHPWQAHLHARLDGVGRVAQRGRDHARNHCARHLRLRRRVPLQHHGVNNRRAKTKVA